MGFLYQSISSAMELQSSADLNANISITFSFAQRKGATATGSKKLS